MRRLWALFIILLLLALPFSLAQTYTLQYDDNGNILQDLDKRYEYNGFNQLKKVYDTQNNLLEEYKYDHNGQRIKKIQHFHDGSIETTYYFGELVRVVNSTGTYDYFYIRDDKGNLLIKKNPDGSKHYYHPDHLGSTSLVTDEQGNVVEETSYLPFGDTLSGGEDRYGYTGQEKDSTDLMYYGARYMNPTMRQFTQPDTVIPDVYDPQALNRFSYVRNNPYKYVDPTGHYSCSFDSGCFQLDLFGETITVGNVQYDEGDSALNSGELTSIPSSEMTSDGQWKTDLAFGAGIGVVGVEHLLSNPRGKMSLYQRLKQWWSNPTKNNLQNKGLMHSWSKHAKEVGFPGKSWKAERDAWLEFNQNIINNPDKVFSNILRGNRPVTGYYKNVDGLDVVTFVDVKTGEIASAWKPTDVQKELWGII